MKKPTESKTIKFAGFLAVFGAIQVALPTLQLEPEMYGYINMGVAVAVAWLRFKTSQPIGK